jgi:hypothetical protein
MSKQQEIYFGSEWRGMGVGVDIPKKEIPVCADFI